MIPCKGSDELNKAPGLQALKAYLKQEVPGGVPGACAVKYKETRKEDSKDADTYFGTDSSFRDRELAINTS
eukprot:1160821-Pelagomonas_calceolata.AAC.10